MILIAPNFFYFLAVEDRESDVIQACGCDAGTGGYENKARSISRLEVVKDNQT